MRAIIQNELGGPEVLRLADAPPPTGDLTIRVKAAGVNPVDVAVRAGYYPILGEPPFILGWDVSGVVEAVAPGVTGFAVGDAVFGMPRFPKQAGAYAEIVSAPVGELAKKPAGLDHIQAAALPLAGLTAWQALVGAAGIKAGDRVLIHAGAGGVGHLAVQIAKAKGAYVIATASAGKLDFVRGLGADEAIDYAAAPFETAAKEIDVALTTVGGDYLARSFSVLKPTGILVTIVDGRNPANAERAKELGLRFAAVSVVPDKTGLQELARLVDSGKLRVHVEKTFPLEQAADAHRFLATRPKGKVVLTM